MWAGSYVDAARAIDAALTGAAALAPGQIDRAGDGTLIGYSNGAYFAAEVACAQQGRWPGLVLLSMKVDLDPARLKKAGVRRVLLGAGDRDGASASMKAASERLLSGGVQARFMSLGPGGHEFPADIGARMCEAVAWVRYQAAGVCTPRP